MPPMGGLRRRLPFVALMLALVSGCASSAASPIVSTTPVTPPPSATPTASASLPGESTMPFTLTSTAFTEGGAIPKKFSCDGENVSPALNWDGAPDDSASLALIVDDPDAGGFVHWVMFDMTASQTGGVPEGFSASPDAPPQGSNGRGQVG